MFLFSFNIDFYIWVFLWFKISTYSWISSRGGIELGGGEGVVSPPLCSPLLIIKKWQNNFSKSCNKWITITYLSSYLFVFRITNSPTKHLCIWVPAPYLHQFSAAVQKMHCFGAILEKNSMIFGANLALSNK